MRFLRILEIFSIQFLFLFLPLSVGVYFLLPKFWKNIALIGFSAAFIFINGIELAVVLISALVIDFFMAPYLVSLANLKARICLLLLVAKNIFVIYILSRNNLLSTEGMYFLSALVLFSSVNYLREVYVKSAKHFDKFSDFFLYTSFFGKLPAGQIPEANNFAVSLKTPFLSWKNFDEGCILISHAFGKKVLLADSLVIVLSGIKAVSSKNETFLSVFLVVFVAMLQVYFCLSAYSDVARGIGMLFGLDIPQGFKHPFFSFSVGDFFRNFNITVHRLILQVVYIVTGELSRNIWLSNIEVLLALVLSGIWYGVAPTYLVWGLVLGVLIILENLTEEIFLKYLPKAIRMIFTFVVVLLSFSFFTAADVSQGLHYLNVLLGIEQRPFYDNTVMYVLTSNRILLVCAVLFASNIFIWLGRVFKLKNRLIFNIISGVFNIGVLLLSAIFLIAKK